MNMRAWILWLVLCISFSTGYTASLKNISINVQGNKTTLYLTLEGTYTHKLFTLTNPDRVVLDIENSNSAINIQQSGIASGLIKQARSGKPNPHTLRLVFDLNRRVEAHSIPWNIQGTNRGLQLEFIGTFPMQHVASYSGNESKAPKKRPLTISNPVAKTNTMHAGKLPRITHDKPIKASHAPSKNARDVIIVLDAGHGGKDPGARGPKRSEEKNVVLAITLKLKQLIDRQPGMRAVLTRSGDYYVGLRQRLEISRKYEGDIFVSIHADAFNNPHSKGASVFALSQRGATSEAARWIAEKENYSELGGVNLGDLDDSNGIVRSVLIDLSQTATIKSSVQMGNKVLGQLYQFTSLHNHKVEQAGFLVLKSPDTPSILVETGFISNPKEERNLNSPAYQNRLSQAIFQGIKAYFWENPPHGTKIEAMLTPRYHIVQPGETLPIIAASYKVSIKSLMAQNHLFYQRQIKTGQKLVIPSLWA